MKTIARESHFSTRAIYRRFDSLYETLGVPDRLSALVKLAQLGLLEPRANKTEIL